jgi:4-diphosphocytidyl-2-C-methyl-D-erythritol kinase
VIKEKAYAKINIGLDITGRRPDGFHNIDTIMQSVSLHDEITIEKAPGINIECCDSAIPSGKLNTAFSAATVFFKEAGIIPGETGAKINIVKNIPLQAGLGGGSSDAAAVIRGLDKLYCTEFSTSIMEQLALTVGSDVPFCIKGGTQRAKGRGEKLTVMDSFKGIPVVIIMPPDTVDTAYAYSLYSKATYAVHPDMDKVAAAIKSGNLDMLSLCAGNTFEGLISPEKPLIEKAKHDILDTGAEVCQMTGSGAAVYGFYNTYEQAKSAHASLSADYTAYLAETTGRIE